MGTLHNTAFVRPLGRTGLDISAVAFGAGPVSGLMTAAGKREQRETVERAIERGINWFDTAASYGAGQSELSLGEALADLGAPDSIHVATKVRLAAEDLSNIKEAVKRSVASSLKRLRRERVTLLQLHNSITQQRGDMPTSITPADVYGKGGVQEAFEELRAEGVVGQIGLTGMGHLKALRNVLDDEVWRTVQVNEHVLVRRADKPASLLMTCEEHGAEALAIRVFAGGALCGQPPSAHTLKTPFFPLAIYERDQANARLLAALLPEGLSLPEVAIRHVVGGGKFISAIVGFSTPNQVSDVVKWAARGPLPNEIRRLIEQLPLPEEEP